MLAYLLFGTFGNIRQMHSIIQETDEKDKKRCLWLVRSFGLPIVYCEMCITICACGNSNETNNEFSLDLSSFIHLQIYLLFIV